VLTSISAIREVLANIGGPKAFAIEETSISDWLYRNLVEEVDYMVVSEPRRNRLRSWA